MQVNIHEGKINDVCARGETMVENKHFALLDIQDKIGLLRKRCSGVVGPARSRHRLAWSISANLPDPAIFSAYS